VLYVLDEPTDGLDASTTTAVLRELRAAQERGKQHSSSSGTIPRSCAPADHVVELGPGAGREGGTIVFEGTAAALAKAETATGRSLRQKKPPHASFRKPRAQSGSTRSGEEPARDGSVDRFSASTPS
jgi:excinuclease UvrABC ATPase subunit